MSANRLSTIASHVVLIDHLLDHAVLPEMEPVPDPTPGLTYTDEMIRFVNRVHAVPGLAEKDSRK